MILEIGQAIVLAGVLLATIRIYIGPTTLDRVLAFDIMSIGLLGAITIEGARTGQSAYLDVAIIIALLAFLSTAALALHVHRGDDA